jgi:hypothetical protein
MSIHDSMMRMGGAPTLMGGLGDKGSLVYKSAGGVEILCDAIIDREKGGLRPNLQAGDVDKVIRRTVKITTEQLTGKGVIGLEQFGVVILNGKTWQIDVSESDWGPAFVKLGLIIFETSRHEDMQSRGAI